MRAPSPGLIHSLFAPRLWPCLPAGRPVRSGRETAPWSPRAKSTAQLRPGASEGAEPEPVRMGRQIRAQWKPGGGMSSGCPIRWPWPCASAAVAVPGRTGLGRAGGTRGPTRAAGRAPPSALRVSVPPRFAAERAETRRAAGRAVPRPWDPGVRPGAAGRAGLRGEGKVVGALPRCLRDPDRRRGRRGAVPCAPLAIFNTTRFFKPVLTKQACFRGHVTDRVFTSFQIFSEIVCRTFSHLANVRLNRSEDRK